MAAANPNCPKEQRLELIEQTQTDELWLLTDGTTGIWDK
jgi:hypothetical protein